MTSRYASVRTRSEADRVTYVGHATVLLELDGMRFLTDPVLRSRLAHLRRQGPTPAGDSAADLDAILISHLHHDHTDLPSLRRLAAADADPGARAAPAGSSGAAASTAVTELAPGDSETIGGVEVTAVEAEHGGGRRRALR